MASEHVLLGGWRLSIIETKVGFLSPPNTQSLRALSKPWRTPI